MRSAHPHKGGAATWVGIWVACLCASGQAADLLAPQFDVPLTFRQQPQEDVNNPNFSDGTWWELYGSDELNRLVDRARANNPDLHLATLQVVQAKLRLDQTKAGSSFVLSAPLRTVSQNGGGSADALQSSQVGLQASYRLDIWGEQRALEESAELQTWRAVYERENTQRNVIGTLVMAYITYLEVSDSLETAKQNEALAQEILEAVEKKLALGDATANELEMQKSVVYLQAAQIASLENQRDDALNSLARVLGTTTSELTMREQGLGGIALPEIRPGLPSALLLRRPDIRLVEARLRAANADIDVARARLLPPIDLSAQAGYSALSLSNLFSPQNFVANVIATLAITIFDGGRRQAEKNIAETSRQQLVETYAQTIIQALREVDSAMSALRTSRARMKAQVGISAAALNMMKIASQSYASNAIDLPALLDARRTYQRSQDDLQKAKSDYLRAYATLCFVLGGGEVDEPPKLVEDTSKGGQKQPAPEAVYGAGIKLVTSEQLRAHQGWGVGLQSLVYQNEIDPVWRELLTRHGAVLNGKFLYAVRQGGLSERLDERQSWYSIVLGDFVEKTDAERFCLAVRKSFKGCTVLHNSNYGMK